MQDLLDLSIEDLENIVAVAPYSQYHQLLLSLKKKELHEASLHQTHSGILYGTMQSQEKLVNELLSEVPEVNDIPKLPDPDLEPEIITEVPTPIIEEAKPTAEPELLEPELTKAELPEPEVFEKPMAKKEKKDKKKSVDLKRKKKVRTAKAKSKKSTVTDKQKKANSAEDEIEKKAKSKKETTNKTRKKSKEIKGSSKAKKSKKKKNKKSKPSEANNLSDFSKWLLDKGYASDDPFGKKQKKKKGKKKKGKKKDKALIKGKEVISEPLAQLLANQGHIGKAIDMYNKLILIFPEKRDVYSAAIEELKTKK